MLLNDAAGNPCTHGGEPLRVTISPRAAQHGDYGEILSVTHQPAGSFLLPSAPCRGPSRGPSPSPDPSPSSSPSPNPDQVIDRLDGTFLVTYVAGLSGRYLIALTLRGEPLRGSPLAVHVPLEDPTTPRATLVRSASLRDGMRDVVWSATQAGGSPLVARDGAGGTFYVLD